MGLIVGAFWLARRPTEPVPQAAVVSSKRSLNRDEGYVGSDACGQCHHEISDAYKTHPMFLSTRLITDTEFAGLHDATIARRLPRIKGKHRF